MEDTIEIDKVTQHLVEFSFEKRETVEQSKQDFLRGRCIEYFTQNEVVLNDLSLTSELSGIIEQYEKEKEIKKQTENNEAPSPNKEESNLYIKTFESVQKKPAETESSCSDRKIYTSKDKNSSMNDSLTNRSYENPHHKGNNSYNIGNSLPANGQI